MDYKERVAEGIKFTLSSASCKKVYDSLAACDLKDSTLELWFFENDEDNVYQEEWKVEELSVDLLKHLPSQPEKEILEACVQIDKDDKEYQEHAIRQTDVKIEKRSYVSDNDFFIVNAHQFFTALASIYMPGFDKDIYKFSMSKERIDIEVFSTVSSISVKLNER